MRKLACLAASCLILPLGIALAADHNKSDQSMKNEKVTLTGCLEQGQGGNYMLRDDMGKEVMIASTAKLSKHVNHTVKVTGNYTGNSTDNSPTSSTSANSGDRMFKVTKVEHVSDTCASSSSSAPRSSPKPNR